ncbi:MAG: type II toxin-antitoxin system VapC family toxin, partial [Opitutales bacterium]
MSRDSILVDTNVLVDLFLGAESLKEKAEALRRRHPYWMTLPLCRYEFGNALRTYTRAGHIDEDLARNFLR